MMSEDEIDIIEAFRVFDKEGQGMSMFDDHFNLHDVFESLPIWLGFISKEELDVHHDSSGRKIFHRMKRKK